MAEKKKQKDQRAEDVEIMENEASAEQTQAASNEDMVPASELTACRDELAQMKDQFLRARADMENYRRRMQRDKEEMAKFANEGILKEILPVVDNLDRAIAHAREQEEKGSSLLDGVEMTQRQLHKVLEKYNVVPIDALEKPFDSACHEAMGQMERDDCPHNTVVEEMQKGYTLNERLLRPSMVMVSKKNSSEDEGKNSQ
ncbi:MAG: nucleotide exchange factor GrpE [Desulfuromonadaceae bacterium]|nr:nucleotide exchange factor GrpE [Geobacteraceae bacterium]